MSNNDLDDWEIEIDNDTNKEHLKKLEERKLVEESDNVLTKELFEDKSLKQVINVNINVNTNANANANQNKEIYLKNKITKQKENEIKQKETSKKNKETKLQKENEVELFGEAEDYYYEDYEEKYYN
jgi:hypothetical protein